MHPKPILLLVLLTHPSLHAGFPDSLVLDGRILIQGSKFDGPSDVATSRTGNNMDEWWGRAALRADYRTPTLKSQVVVTMYPSNFGFEPLVKANLISDSGNADSLKTQATKIDLFVLSDAWVSFPVGPVDLKLGRFETFLGPGTAYFGDYIDEDLYCGFLYKGAVHNGAELSKAYGGHFTSAMFQTGDRNLNTGRLRLQQSYRSEGLELDLAFRSNVFDFLRRANHATAEQRLHGIAAYGDPTEWRVYLEAAGIYKESEDRLRKVALLGLNLPSGGVFERVSLEAEFAVDRTVVDDGGRTIDKPLLWNVQCQRKLGDHLALTAAVFTDPKGGSYADLGVGSRLTARLW